MTPTTLLHLVEAGFAKNQTGVCLATRRGGVWLHTSVDQFRRDVEHLSLGLESLGVRAGDRVALHAENSAEWLTADQAILSLGAVSVPIYTTQPADQIEYILRDAGAVGYIVSTPALRAEVAGRLGELPELRFQIGIIGEHGAGVLPWAEVLKRGAARAVEAPNRFAEARAAVHPGDLATLIYTSGTTGTPKGVMLSHWNLASNVLASLERMPWEIEGERGGAILSYLPLSHVFERMMGYLYLHIGYPVWFVENFEQILEDLQHVRPVHFSSVPRLLDKIYAGIHAKTAQLHGAQRAILTRGLALADRYDVEQPLPLTDRVQYALADALVFRKLRDLFGGRLRAITSGGAPLSAKVMNFMNAIGIFCGQGYGLSETSPVIAVYEKGRLRAGSVGTPIRGVELRIADDGEICVRSPGVMQGYLGMPEATAEVMDAEGWFRTGDIGRVDADGYLFITDRKKELLKLSTGKYIAPQPIETRLGGSPWIEQAVVVGNARQFCTALLVPDTKALDARAVRTGAPLDDAGLHALIQQEVDAANAGLPHWEQVKRWTLVPTPWSIDTGELTPTLKVKRRVVLEHHAADVEGMYA